jgi:hypothetical protein
MITEDEFQDAARIVVPIGNRSAKKSGKETDIAASCVVRLSLSCGECWMFITFAHLGSMALTSIDWPTRCRIWYRFAISAIRLPRNHRSMERFENGAVSSSQS